MTGLFVFSDGLRSGRLTRLGRLGSVIGLAEGSVMEALLLVGLGAGLRGRVAILRTVTAFVPGKLVLAAG